MPHKHRFVVLYDHWFNKGNLVFACTKMYCRVHYVIDAELFYHREFPENRRARQE